MLATKKNVLKYISENIDTYEGETLVRLSRTFIDGITSDDNLAQKELNDYVNDRSIDETGTKKDGIFGAFQMIASHDNAIFGHTVIEDISTPVNLEKAINTIRMDNILESISLNLSINTIAKLTKQNIKDIKHYVESV